MIKLFNKCLLIITLLCSSMHQFGANSYRLVPMVLILYDDDLKEILTVDFVDAIVCIFIYLFIHSFYFGSVNYQVYTNLAQLVLFWHEISIQHALAQYIEPA